MSCIVKYRITFEKPISTSLKNTEYEVDVLLRSSLTLYKNRIKNTINKLNINGNPKITYDIDYESVVVKSEESFGYVYDDYGYAMRSKINNMQYCEINSYFIILEFKNNDVVNKNKLNGVFRKFDMALRKINNVPSWANIISVEAISQTST